MKTNGFTNCCNPQLGYDTPTEGMYALSGTKADWAIVAFEIFSVEVVDAGVADVSAAMPIPVVMPTVLPVPVMSTPVAVVLPAVVPVKPALPVPVLASVVSSSVIETFVLLLDLFVDHFSVDMDSSSPPAHTEALPPPPTSVSSMSGLCLWLWCFLV